MNYPSFYITSKDTFLSSQGNSEVSIECQYCGNLFYSKKKNILRNLKVTSTFTKFCSAKCGQKFLNKDKTIVVLCKECEKPITKRVSKIQDSGNCFCSSRCSASFNNRLRARKYPLRPCTNCGIIYSKTRHTKETCSITCAIERRNKDKVAREVVKRTGANSYDVIRKNARSYSSRILPQSCMNCGYSKHFEVAHIKSISEFDLDSCTLFDINNRSNLIHLCRNCHWEFDSGLLSMEDIGKSPYYVIPDK